MYIRNACILLGPQSSLLTQLDTLPQKQLKLEEINPLVVYKTKTDLTNKDRCWSYMFKTITRTQN